MKCSQLVLNLSREQREHGWGEPTEGGRITVYIERLAKCTITVRERIQPSLRGWLICLLVQHGQKECYGNLGNITGNSGNSRCHHWWHPSVSADAFFHFGKN